jgi:hypothetical protein
MLGAGCQCREIDVSYLLQSWAGAWRRTRSCGGCWTCWPASPPQRPPTGSTCRWQQRAAVTLQLLCTVQHMYVATWHGAGGLRILSLFAATV